MSERRQTERAVHAERRSYEERRQRVELALVELRHIERRQMHRRAYDSARVTHWIDRFYHARKEA